MNLTLAKFFSTYGSYHNDPINKLIHIICVPAITTTLLAMITHYSPHIDLHLGKPFELNYSLMLVLIVATVYLYVDLYSGLVSSALYIGAAFLTTHLYYKLVDTPYYETYMKIIIVIHIASWLIQVAGHSFFEKRSPALLDNVYQIFIAPDFVVLEVMFMLGYRPQAHKEAQTIIDKNISEFKASLVKKAH